MLPKANPKYISKKLFDELKLKVPKNIYKYIAKETIPTVSGQFSYTSLTSRN
jgi:hypothetical protein